MNKENNSSGILKPAIFFISGLTFIFLSVYFGTVTPGGIFGVHLLSVVLMGLWILKMLHERECIFKKSFLFFPILLFIILLFHSRFFSIYIYSTKVVFLNYLSYFFVYCVFINTLSDNDIKRLIRLLVIISVGVSLFGLLCYFFKKYELFFYTKLFYKDRLNATFVNPNHFACYLNFMIPCTLFFFIASKGIKRILFLSALMILFVSLVLTFSHSGIIAFFIGILYFMLTAIRKRLLQKRYIFPFVLLFIFSAVIFVIYKFSTVNTHLELKKIFSYGSHWLLWKGCLSLLSYNVLNSPLTFLTGCGLGNFAFVYNTFHPILTLNFYEYAHNDYLQILIEIGLTGILIFMLIFISVMRAGIRQIESTDRESILLQLAVKTSLIAYFIHLLFDFNFYITANSLLFFSFLAFLDVFSINSFIKLRWKLSFIVFLTFIAAFLLGQSFCSFSSRLLTNRAISLVHQGDFDKSHSFFKRALWLNTLNAEIYYECGEMFFYRAQKEVNVNKSYNFINEAQTYFDKAISINPNDARYYIRLADLKIYLNDMKGAEENLNEVERLAPNFILYRLKKIQFYLGKPNQQYDKASDELNFL